MYVCVGGVAACMCVECRDSCVVNSCVRVGGSCVGVRGSCVRECRMQLCVGVGCSCVWV